MKEDKTYKEYIELVIQSQKLLDELRKFSVCNYCGKFYKGTQKNTKYCSIKCTKAMYEKKKFSQMTEEELKQYRLKERDRIRKYRNEKKINKTSKTRKEQILNIHK